MSLTAEQIKRAAVVIEERTRHYVPSFLAEEAIEELQAAGWKITPAVDPDHVHDAHEWADRYLGRKSRLPLTDQRRRTAEFVALAITHEPDAVLRIAARIAERHRAARIDTTGT